MTLRATEPLAIDLFCGLSQPEFIGSAYLFVDKLVARWAKNPDHVPLAIRHDPPSAVAFMAGPVRYLQNPAFSACLARLRDVRVFSAQPLKRSIFVWAPRIVDFLEVWFPFVERSALLFCCNSPALSRAISLVAVWPFDRETVSADRTVAAGFRDIGLFAAPKPPSAALARGGAISLVWPFRMELAAAFGAKQIIHMAYIS